ncbi:hypothetical protein CARUB_v10016324mg [Capsella rubella]|uniref:Uncharacterized protein n=1 Tax=Capsella rubella TaxID=81985 RepID=R0HT89_9BRAS|nr:hypothetical protein CARUB_v10016324mg [Capsella rubella]
MRQFLLVITIVLLRWAFSVRCSNDYSKNDFPEGFVFGSAFSAFQIELDSTNWTCRETYIRPVILSRHKSNPRKACTPKYPKLVIIWCLTKQFAVWRDISQHRTAIGNTTVVAVCFRKTAS